VFGALGRATAWLGPAGNGTRAKLVLNNWLADLTETTAETLAFARQLGLDPAGIVDLLDSTPLGSPYAVQKARAMLAGDFAPAFALKHALKDADLAAQAAQATGAELTLTSALLPRWRQAAASGHADEDLAAIYATT
jgi:3-hydroxyisobutyrate dehydrogenase